MQCCADHKSVLGFYTSPVEQDPEKSNRWVCFVEDAYIPQGEYILETPLSREVAYISA